MSKPLIYLATCYSHSDAAVREYRYEIVTAAAALIRAAGRFEVFSPITHSHPLFLACSDLGSGWDEWAEFNRRMIAACDEVWILTLRDWTESRGVQAEVLTAEEQGKPVWRLRVGETEPEDRRRLRECAVH